MNLQQLRYVRALTEEGSFVAAAARCAVTQPTLSNGIARLEADLGNRIFRRTTRSVALTEYGERVLPAILEALDAFDQVRTLAKQAGSNVVHVNAAISPVVGIRIAELALELFKAQRPGVEVIYREGNLLDICEMMKRSQIDLIFAPLDPRSQALSDCLIQWIYAEPLYFVPRKAGRTRWSDMDHVTIKEIAEEQIVLVPDACGLTHVTKRLFDENNCQLNRYRGEASSYTAIADWTDINLGSGILPASKLSPSDKHRPAIPIFEGGQPAMIDYYAIGRPNTIPAPVFNELWRTLHVESVTAAREASQPRAGVPDWCL